MSEVKEIQIEKVPQIPADFQPSVAIKASSSEGLAAVTKAMCEARPKFGVIKKSAENPFYKDAKGKNRKYADISEIIGNTADQLAECGIYIFQAPFINNDRTVGITSLISHISGGFVEMTISGCPADQRLKEGGSRYDAQTIGIGFTYLARYALRAALNLGTEDDDGNGIANTQPQELPKRFGPGSVINVPTNTIPQKALAAESSPLMDKPTQISNADNDGCPLSDSDLVDPLPSEDEKKGFGVRLKGLKQDTRLLKTYVEKWAGKSYSLITRAQFNTLLPILEKAKEDNSIGELLKA